MVEDQLLQAVLTALEQDPDDWPGSENEVRCWEYEDEFRLECAAARGLPHLGFYSTHHAHEGRSVLTGKNHLVKVFRGRPNLVRIKSAFADAVVERKKLLVVTTGGITRDAAAWADDQEVPVFWMRDPRDEFPSGLRAEAGFAAANSVAASYLPEILWPIGFGLDD